MKKENLIKLKGSIILVLCAFFWGTTFIAQRKAAMYVGAYTYNFVRSIIGTILLIFCFLFTKKKIKVENTQSKKKTYIYASLAGIALFLGATLQQLSLDTIGAGKSAFITALYIIFVPIIGLLFKDKVKWYIWPCTIIALFGSFLLTKNDSFSLDSGSFLAFLCSIAYALQIIFVGKAAKDMNPFHLCAIELCFLAVGSLFGMIIKEGIDIDAIIKILPYGLYAGVFSSCIAYSLQIVGQKYSDPAVATLIMSLESVFAFLGGVIILNETFSLMEGLGSLLILISVIISQLDFDKLFKKNKKDKEDEEVCDNSSKSN